MSSGFPFQSIRQLILLSVTDMPRPLWPAPAWLHLLSGSGCCSSVHQPGGSGTLILAVGSRPTASILLHLNPKDLPQPGCAQDLMLLTGQSLTPTICLRWGEKRTEAYQKPRTNTSLLGLYFTCKMKHHLGSDNFKGCYQKEKTGERLSLIP